jgi:hypothetical protein
MQFLLIAGAVILFAGFLILSFYLEAKRRKELALWAQSKRLVFSAGKNYGMEARFPELSALRQGENRYACNVMEGDWAGRPVTAFDYHYETYSHDSKGRRQTHHYNFSTVVIGSSLPLKQLFIRPEGLFDKVAEFFGVDDIDFESAEFSRKFFVKANDRKWAYDVIHTRTMEFLLGSPRFTIQFIPMAVAAWRASTFSVRDFEAAAEVIRGILDRLPDYLVKQLKEGF